ncbi:DUF72 domain-containing protein [Sporosarcina sp. JAI121]|uniref:DUF72 domain-containing protein n=1 Tax=Sporosarcina sp. JAI121 TaxID=2723064 RepID=UPI0015CBC49B|nr:DUF72 domain-containing protein [Sporosarcina sp. JAI121]NYF26172.1 uncharacterized protein YecE (DUF72 family) [Sporosarcina sp. JAI121]
MIQIGLTGWGDHPDVYDSSSSKKEKLIDYSAHFPIVELDATFYAIQPERNIQKWIEETPDNFRFIVKAYQGMTGHHRGELPYESIDKMYDLFRLSVTPLREAGKLAMILVQFPPWFDCTKGNVEEIRFVCSKLAGFDIAVEFRHQSWYSPEYLDRTLAFLERLNVIHSVCDEPQAGLGSIPLVPITTRSDKVLFRLHGRNVAGWRNTTGDDQAWRKVRYLYNYSDAELMEIQLAVQKLQEATDEVFVIFNNNSGGHAAQNAKRFQKMLNINYESLAPKQLDFFEGEW